MFHQNPSEEVSDVFVTPGVIKAYQAKLIEAAKQGDIKIVKKLLSQKDCPIDIDARDPETGRTALHEASFNKKESVIKVLLAHGASGTIRDKLGFLPLELFLNIYLSMPKDFNFSEKQRIILNDENYYRFIASEANDKLVTHQGVIIFVQTIQEMMSYIESHPEQNRIGFLMEVPNVLKKSFSETHVSPIYFERKNNTETFVQFDSAAKAFYLPPRKKDIKRTLFYSGCLRQAANYGCFEDALLILKKLLNSNGLLNYCAAHAVDQTENLSTPLTEDELRQLQAIHEFGNMTQSFPSPEVRDLYLLLSARKAYQNQCVMLSEEKMQPIELIYLLTDIPKILIPHIERFDTMRDIRTKSPEQLLKRDSTGRTMLSLILKSGTIRHGAPESVIESNLSNPNPLFDFAGFNFLKRHKGFQLIQNLRCKNVHSWFHHKVRKQLRLAFESETNQIVDTINEFATGKKFR